ncbi:hybrid sensor histidine kinase/response regulator [Dysgonomonas sp. 521]|uniref:hybrid sensor histidine kinase/response regulator transcription factor n=1 Tax=Dysgonomonas sp. 521 TaxID=2302932 RepID=UPI0013D8C4C2|nr:hybrid sensor histidine kinase/response regulator transcription factor [Dysgonomonas sp. 521]NDV95144.1 hybrid sensor histidine kinase/response regulator [Dysgonomonas sp. 521]
MKFILLIISAISFFLTAHSSNIRFYDINTIHSINMREVASVCKDKNGFIWSASKTGILRLSDDDYHIYQLPYETADIIYTKLVYEHGNLSAFTNNGQVFCYNEILDKFELLIDIRKPLNDSHLVLYEILTEENGSLLMATTVGLYKYHKGNLSQIEKQLSQVQNITWYDKHQLFILEPNGIWLMDTKTMKSKHIYKYTERPSIRFTCSYYDKEEKLLWCGTTSDGLFYYNVATGNFSESSFPKQPIQAIEPNSDSTILIGIDGQGIWELARKGNKVLNIYKEDVDNPSSLKGDGVYDIFSDENKRIWVCTYSGGLSYFDQVSANVNHLVHQIGDVNSLNNNVVNKIIEDSRGIIWFATNNGISSWNRNSNKWKTYFDDNKEQAQVFLSLCEDNKGNIWAGTYSSGFYVIDGKTGQEIKYYSKNAENSSLTNNFIFDIFKDSDGDLWMGSPLGDVFCYVENENKFKVYPYLPVHTFAELSPDNILLACTYGLSILNKQTAETEILLDGYLLYDILLINDDAWLCTSGDGLLRFNLKNKSTEKFTTESGLPSNYINSILLEDGYLWLGTENGLCRFNPEDKSVLICSSLSPYLNVSFNQNSNFKLKNGQLIWGSNNGAAMFEPIAIQYAQPEGRIFFQDMIISGRSIRNTPSLKLDTPLDNLHKISLGYEQNTLTIEFLSIGMSTVNSKFSWKMEGIDEEWTQPTNSRVLTYASIPSGDFKLKIRMYDSSLSHVINERTLDIHITPPFWKTWWFRFIIIVFVGGIVFFALRFYINRLKQKHTEDKIRFFTNTAHDIRTSLTLINAPIEELNKEQNLSEKGHYYLNLATEQSGRLSFVTTQLLDFQKVDIGKGQVFLIMTDIVSLVYRRKSMFEAMAKKQNISVEFSSNEDSYMTAVDELKIEKIVDNLISNAIKYSHPDGKVEIKLECENDRWALEVKDYGLGISNNAKNKLFKEFYRGDNTVNSKMVGSGIGLLLTKNYVSMHHGDISFDSKENEGSKFRVTIPYKKVSFTQPVVNRNKTDELANIQKESQESDLSKKEILDEKKAHILIVEDNNDLQNFLAYSFQDQYNITVTNDGVEAWNQIAKKLPDLIISDIMMPNMDGFELCRLVKSTYETSHIPIVLLTALTEKTQQLQGLGFGADDYLTKPFDMALLSQRIKTIIQNRKTVRDKALKLINEKNDEPILSNEMNDKFVKKAVEVVRSNMDNPEFDKETFASAMNVSSSLLYKKIKSLTDQSPIDFIKSIRLNYASELLQTKKYTVTEVSIMCGFSSIKYFSSAFKKHFGKSPSEI